MNSEIEKTIEEVVPELSQSTKSLGFFRAMAQVVRFWIQSAQKKDGIYDGTNFLGGMAVMSFIGASVGFYLQMLTDPAIMLLIQGTAAGFFVGIAYTLVCGYLAGTNDCENSPVITAAYWVTFPVCGLAGSLWGHSVSQIFTAASFPLIPWIAQAFYWMKKARKPQIPILPSAQEVQKRMLERMQAEITKAKGDVIGEGSAFENCIAELRVKRNNALKLVSYFKVRRKDYTTHSAAWNKFDELVDEATSTADLLKLELETLNKEQDTVLALFNEIEAFIPAENTRLADDAAIAMLRVLRGEALEARAVTREMLMETVQPVFQKLSLLNQARERLLSHSIAALQPVSLEKFFESTEAGAESVARVGGALRQIAERTGQELIS